MPKFEAKLGAKFERRLREVDQRLGDLHRKVDTGLARVVASLERGVFAMGVLAAKEKAGTQKMTKTKGKKP